MTALDIIKALTEAVQAAQTLLADFNAGRVVLSETDAKAVHQALLDAEAATDALRPQVDAALEAAAQR